MATYSIDYKVGDDGAKNHGWVPASRDFGSIKKYYKTEAEAEAASKEFAKAKNVRVRVRKNG